MTPWQFQATARAQDGLFKSWIRSSATSTGSLRPNGHVSAASARQTLKACLLYTSDAADDM
eukprot:647664-Alexandrium_andersonii.AAC.1